MRIVNNKRFAMFLIVFVVISFFISSMYFQNKKTISTFLPITNKVITIDPGHGGVDPGAVSARGTKEDEINLEIALKLKRLIEQSGGIVIMTREEDVGLHSDEAESLGQMKREDLKRRKEIVDNSGSEIFISIHLNSFINTRYHGAQTFYREGSKEGQDLALIIQEQLKNILDKENKRAPQKRDNIYLLNEIDIPAVLVECGFLSNPQEDKILRDENYQEKIAWAIYIGVMNYLNEEDR